VLAVTVPGAVDGWFSLHQRFGRLEMPRVARAAIHHARDGFRVTPFLASAIRGNLKLLAANGGGADVFAPDGRAPDTGDRLVEADLANSLEQIAREGPSAMYRGSLGARVQAFVAQQGGGLSADDFAAQRSEWVEPISARYRDLDVFELPPNSQGVALL